MLHIGLSNVTNLLELKTIDQIQGKLKRAKEGTILFLDDFKGMGSPASIRVSLHRLVKKNILLRLAKGIYAKPIISTLLNKEVKPSLEKIAFAIARRDKARLLPTGSFALNALGLSEQIPLNIVFYTNGSPRKVKIGEGSITFKKAGLKRMALKGEISKLVVQALSEIGNGNVKEVEEKKIIELLKKENIKDLKHDIELASQWIAEIMAKAL